MTDDEILEALDRRFAGVESRLPPTRVAVLGNEPVRGATVAGGALRAALLPLVVVLVVAVLAAGTLALRPFERLPATGAAASTSAASAALTSPLSAPAASASDEPLLILRGSSGGDTLLIEHFRWGPTMCGSDPLIAALDGRAVDRAVDKTGSEEGWVEVPVPLARQPAEARVWVGRSPEAAATAYGSRVLAIGGRGDTWIVLNEMGREMVPFTTPRSRTFWILIGGIANGTCGQNQP